jgi:hypothetical protein
MLDVGCWLLVFGYWLLALASAWGFVSLSLQVATGKVVAIKAI